MVKLNKQGESLALRRDMTQGNVIKKIMLFALPVLLGQVISQLYNVADSVVAGNFISANALAAVGTGFTLMMINAAVLSGLGIGGGIVVAQLFGSKRQEELTKAINTAYIIGLMMGIFFLIFGNIIVRPLLGLLNTPSDIIGQAEIYLRIIYLGSTGELFYFLGSGILRGLGDSKWPTIFLIICSCINISLDLFFVVGLGMGVAGLALATITAQLISAILIILRIRGGGYGVSINRKTLRFDKTSAKLMVKLGVPTAAQALVTSMGGLVIQFFTNNFGAAAVSANTIIMRIDGFVLLPMMGVGQALTTFVGQNMGAGKPDRVSKGINTMTGIIVCTGLLLGAVIFFFGEPFIHIFLDAADPNAPAIIEMGSAAMKVLAFFVWATGFQQMYVGIMRGAGAVTVTMIIAFIGMLIRIPLSYFLAVAPGRFVGMYYAMNIANLTACALVFIYYLTGRWKNKAVVRAVNKPEKSYQSA